MYSTLPDEDASAFNCVENQEKDSRSIGYYLRNLRLRTRKSLGTQAREQDLYKTEKQGNYWKQEPLFIG
jgi:hypothetical protein